MSASRRFTFREVCNYLGIADDEMNVEDETEAEDDMQLDLTEDDEDMEEHLGAIDDEGDIEVAMEGDDEDDEDDEDLTPAATNSDTDTDDDGENLLSPNGLLYTTRSIPARRRIRKVLTQSSRGIATPQNELESFERFLSEGILRTILMHTNRKVREIRRSISRPHIAKIFSMDELKAGLAIILRAGSGSNNFTELANLWVPADSKPFYRAVMSLCQMQFLLRYIRFDNWNTREEQKTLNKLAAVSEVWEIFLKNIRRVYIPNESITVDEQLVGYRGRIPGRTYMPSKPRKYGLKIFWACESSTGYALNAMAYGSREGDRVHRNLGQDVVMKLVEPYFETSRDVCTDNFFTIYNLAKLLLEKKLTLLGTVRRQRRDVPRSMVNKMELYNSKFVYNHQDGICLVAYQAKKNKLPVIMLSSSHFEGVVSTDEAKKPEMILDYNKQKGGVDMFDENVEEFSCCRKTVRWPLLFFYNLLDTATNNAYILLKKSGTYTCSKKVFLKNLTFDLAQPAVDTRLKLARQKESVKTAAIQMGFSLTSVSPP